MWPCLMQNHNGKEFNKKKGCLNNYAFVIIKFFSKFPGFINEAE